MCAILQLVSAPSNPIPIVDHFRRSHPPGATLTYFNDGGSENSEFFGSEILAKSDFLGL